jgi:hypothetical protein
MGRCYWRVYSVGPPPCFGGFDHVQIVFDDDHRVAPVPQLVQNLQQLLDVVEVQAGADLSSSTTSPLIRARTKSFMKSGIDGGATIVERSKLGSSNTPAG